MIKKLFEQGVAAQIQRGNEREATKVGTLRAGNTGMIDRDGNIIGSCAANTYLRMLGINGKPVDLNKELMFAGGRLNEDHWMSVLKESWDGPILAEEEVATCWETDQGIKVTGRPDIVLCNKNNKPKCMIELKQIMSVNSGYQVFVKREPQLKHLMQAAHYMWQLDCDGELWYTNRNNLDMPGWMEFREFPKPEHEPTGVIGYRYYRSGDINPRTGKPKKHQLTEAEYMSGKHRRTFAQASKIKPFVQGFKLQLKDGKLYYQDAGDEKSPWIPTIVEIENIQRFYNFVGELAQYGKVPKPAQNMNPQGELFRWKFADYSDLGELDPEHQQGRRLADWVDKVKIKLNLD